MTFLKDPNRLDAAWWAARTMPEPNTGCLLWTGNACRLGYGRMWFEGRAGVPAHRVAYAYAFGSFDRALAVCHRCDTPSCVNPDHLFLGTQQENLRDMFNKGRSRTRGPSRKARRVAPVATRELALVDSYASVASDDEVHLMRTGATLASWRHVTGVPSHRPTYALVRVECPLERTANPSSLNDDGYPNVATAAACWPLASFGARTAGGAA